MTSEVRGMSRRSSVKWMETRDEESREHEIWALVHSFSAICDIDKSDNIWVVNDVVDG